MASTRTSIRQRVQVEGALFAPSNASVVRCMILDISEKGALVGTLQPIDMPDNVYLWQSKAGAVLKCEVRWRRRNLVGLQFSETNDRAGQDSFVAKCVLATRAASFAAVHEIGAPARMHA